MFGVNGDRLENSLLTIPLLAHRYGDRLDDEADTIIGFAVDGAKRMEVLIEDLLLYSRVGKNGKPLKSYRL